MLYMAITTWDPEKRDALIKSREKGPQTGGKIIGEWVAIGGGRNFRVIEYDDPKVMLASAMTWSGLAQIEFIPIMTTEDALKAVASKK